eukprot:g7103.t1
MTRESFTEKNPNNLEDKNKINVDELNLSNNLGREKNAAAAAVDCDTQIVDGNKHTVLQVSPARDDDQSFITVVEKRVNEDEASESLRSMSVSRTVVESDLGMVNLVKLANAKPLNDTDEGTGNSLKRDVVSMEVPRKPRSKRSTTVVRVPGFTFQKLPSLLSTEEKPGQSFEELPSETRAKETQDDSVAKSASVLLDRKLKLHVTPKRVAVTDVEDKQVDETDKRFYTRTARRARRTTSFYLVDELFQEDYSSPSSASETPKRVRRSKKALTGRQRKMRRQTRTPYATSKKRSLRTIVQSCLRKQRGGVNRQKSFDRTKPERTRRQHKRVYTQYHHSIRKMNDEPSLRFDKDVWSCQTVTYLLSHKLVNVGDTVELLSKEADPVLIGWFTSRGILCSNCGMVHSCALFGACDSRSVTLDCLCVKDGTTLNQLLEGHKIVNLQ